MEKKITQLVNEHNIVLVNEPAYSTDSSTLSYSYATILCRAGEQDCSSAHGVVVGAPESPEASVLLLGVGGATGIHPHSLAHNDRLCFVAAGDAVFALELPGLKMQWCAQVDRATCFAVYWLAAENCLITWGELEVCRYTEQGERVWSASGSDIFEDFACITNYIELTDFNGTRYTVHIKTGKIHKSRPA